MIARLKISSSFAFNFSFVLKDGYRYPMKIGVDLATDELFVVEILYKKVDFNKKSSISFKIPKSYERTD